MSASARCPTCQTELELDGSCGRCRAEGAAAVDGDSPFSPPAVDDVARVEEVDPLPDLGNRATRGQRLAGWLLLVSSVLNFAYLAVFPVDGTAGMTILPSIIDAAIGISLIRGHNGAVGWAIFRVVFGLFVWGGQAAAGGDFVTAGMQLALSAALLLLLIGRASTARIWVGVGVALPMILLTMLGVAMGPDGMYRGQLQAVDESALTGPGYALSTPSKAWRAFDPVQMATRNPDVDTWLVMPVADSHVQVVAEPLATPVDPAAFERLVLDNLRQTTERYDIREREVVDGGAIVHAFATINGAELEYRHRIYVADDVAIQVLAFGTAGNLHEEAVQIVRTAKLGGP